MTSLNSMFLWLDPVSPCGEGGSPPEDFSVPVLSDVIPVAIGGFALLACLVVCMQRRLRGRVRNLSGLGPPPKIGLPKKEVAQAKPFRSQEFSVATQLSEALRLQQQGGRLEPEVVKVSRRVAGLEHSYFVTREGTALRQQHGATAQGKGFLSEGGFKSVYDLLNERGEISHVRCLFRYDGKFRSSVKRQLKRLRGCEHLVPYQYFDYVSKKSGIEKQGLIAPRYDTDLYEWCSSGERRSCERIRAMLQVALGVQEMHEAQCAHLDLKPENCFLNCDEKGEITQLRLGDFDLLRHFSRWSYRKAPLCGTPGYIAPELWNRQVKRGGKGALRADIYSLGWLFATVWSSNRDVEATRKDPYFERLDRLARLMQSPVAKTRPKIAAVVKELQSLVATLEE